MPTWFGGLLMVVAAATLAQLVLTVVHKFRRVDAGRAIDNAMISAALGTVGGAYALFLSFTISVVWHNYSDTQAGVAREANAVANLERMSRGFSLPVQRDVQDSTRTYLRLTIDEEWPLLAKDESSVRADASLIELWHIYTDVSPEERANPLYSQSITRLNEVGDARRLRLLAGTSGVPELIVILLYTGAVATMALACLYEMKSLTLHRILLAFLAVVISFGLFLVGVLDSPFGSRLPISAEPFRYVLNHMQQLEY